MSHYYINDDTLTDIEYQFDYDYKGTKYKFISNTGVFSKKRVDFGTNLLINSLPSFDNKMILDMGTGLGVMAIMIAGANKSCTVLGSDVNRKALDLAKQNAKKNRVDNVSFIESSLYDNITDTFDAIISNPPIRAGKQIVHGVVIDGFNHLKTGGKIYLVIQNKQGAPSLEKKMMEVFGNVKTINKDKGYFIFESCKEN